MMRMEDRVPILSQLIHVEDTISKGWISDN